MVWLETTIFSTNKRSVILGKYLIKSLLLVCHLSKNIYKKMFEITPSHPPTWQPLRESTILQPDLEHLTVWEYLAKNMKNANDISHNKNPKVDRFLDDNYKLYLFYYKLHLLYQNLHVSQ